MSRKHLLSIAVAVLATAMFILPGVALGKGGGKGNGTPSPPPTNPPCDADGHNGTPPPYGGPHAHSGSCKNDRSTGTSSSTSTGETTETSSSSTGETSTTTSSTGTTETTSTSSSTSTSTSTTSTTETTSTSTSTTSTTATTATTAADVCMTDGILGSKGLDAGEDRTIGQILWDELGLVVQDPQIPGDGPLSQPVYDGLISIPLGGLETPVAAEVGCLLNNLSL